mgnify:FL=1
MAYNKEGNKRNNNGKHNDNRKKTNSVMKFDLFTAGVCGEREYAVGSLKDLLNELEENGIFKCISIPIYMYRNDLNTKIPNLRGTTQVGYIRSVNDETVEASIFANYVEAAKNLKNPIVYPRCVVRDQEVVSIIGLDICDASRYAD